MSLTEQHEDILLGIIRGILILFSMTSFAAMCYHQGRVKTHVEGIDLVRTLPPGTYPVTHVIRGIENMLVICRMFPAEGEREALLGRTMVSIASGPGYMRVDSDGTILVAQDHLVSSDERVVYLDFIHELVHVKQAIDGRALYGGSIRYVDRETEIEAYRVAIEEGRRLEMSEEELRDYLDVHWITAEEYQRLLDRVGVSPRET